jgi:hypothetical protein
VKIKVLINGSRAPVYFRGAYYSLVGTIGIWILKRNRIVLDPSVHRIHLGYLLLTGKSSDPNTIRAKVKYFIAFFSEDSPNS